MGWEGKVATLFDNLSIDGAHKAIDERRRNFEKTDGTWRCKRCGEKSRVTTLHIYVKAGLGERIAAFIPFCPKCEGTPKMLRDHIRKKG